MQPAYYSGIHVGMENCKVYHQRTALLGEKEENCFLSRSGERGEQPDIAGSARLRPRPSRTTFVRAKSCFDMRLTAIRR